MLSDFIHSVAFFLLSLPKNDDYLDIEQLYCNLFLSKLGGDCFILFLIINIVEEKSGISLCFFAGNLIFSLL